MKKVLVLFSLCMLLCVPSEAAYLYSRAVTIDHAQVGGGTEDETNFPMAFTGTLPYLATTGNGGLVTSSSGYDIVFTSDSACSSLLKFERVNWSATTGAVEFWVKVPTVSHTTDTVIYLCYDNSSIVSDQQDAANTWDANFKTIYHLKDGSTLSLTDSTGSNNGTNHSATATTGHIDGGMATTTTQWVATGGMPSGANVRTISLWFKLSSSGTNQILYDQGTSALGRELVIYIKATTGLLTVDDNGASQSAGPNTFDGFWHQAAFTNSDSTHIKMYIDGVSVYNNTIAQAMNTDATPQALNTYVGGGGSGTTGILGSYDEVHFSNTNRSDGWIATEFNNQLAPGRFYAVGTEIPASLPTYAYYKLFTIDHTKVGSSDSVNFPFLVSGTYSDLATAANGGKLQNSSGYDICFSTSTSAANALNWERDIHKLTTGQIAYWVKIPAVSHTTDTTFYLLYGSSGVAHDQSSPQWVWDKYYRAVYHFGDGSSVNLTDSTWNANNGTNHSSTAVTSGYVGGAASFVSASTQYVDLGTDMSLNYQLNANGGTLETWLYYTGSLPNGVVPRLISNLAATPSGEEILLRDPASFSHNIYAQMYNGGVFSNAVGYNSGGAGYTPNIVANTWYSVIFPYTSSDQNLHLYWNGAAQSPTCCGTATVTSNQNFNLGREPGTPASTYWDGYLDEVRISATARSADWVTLEYNNLNSVIPSAGNPVSTNNQRSFSYVQ